MKGFKLLRETFSICPVCLKKIKGEIVERDGKILIRKECDLHGNFNDVYWSNVELYNWAQNLDGQFTRKKPSLKQPMDECPFLCGICSLHNSKTVMAVIDVTNECNLKCPTCFADSPNESVSYQPNKETIIRMLKFLKKQDPPPPAVMFSGGEPTVRDDIVDLVKKAHEMRFMILLATNGIRMVQEPVLLDKLKRAGLNIIYLQFDGVTESPYMKLRGSRLLQKKLELIKLCRDYDIEVILVPTIHGGINDNEVGDIIRFAAENVDIIRGIVFQPMSFTGRTGDNSLKKNRICNSLLARLIETQTDRNIGQKDLFPVSLMVPPIKVMSNFLKKSWPLFTPSPHCGLWNWVLVSKTNRRRFTPISHLVDFKRLFSDLQKMSQTSNRSRISKFGIYLRLLLAVLRSLNWKKAQREAGLFTAVKTMINIHTKPSYDSLGGIRRRLLLIGCMAFMDPYTFDVARAKRCVIHYVTPTSQLIPFCAYNILYRHKVESQFTHTTTKLVIHT